MSFEKSAIERARKDKTELSKSYGVDQSRIVWTGTNRYIIVLPDGKEIRI